MRNINYLLLFPIVSVSQAASVVSIDDIDLAKTINDTNGATQVSSVLPILAFEDVTQASTPIHCIYLFSHTTIYLTTKPRIPMSAYGTY